MISLINPLDEVVVWLYVLPQHVVVVSVYLEEGFELVYCLTGRKYSLEVTYSAHLLLRLEQNHPVLGTQDIQTVVVA